MKTLILLRELRNSRVKWARYRDTAYTLCEGTANDSGALSENRRAREKHSAKDRNQHQRGKMGPKMIRKFKISALSLAALVSSLMTTTPVQAQCNFNYNNMGCTQQAINDVYCYHNAFRAAYGLPQLQPNGSLQYYAYLGSLYQSWWSPDWWAHIDTSNRLRAAGFPGGNENVAYNYWWGYPSWQNSSFGTFVGWWNSPVHHNTLMNPGYRYIGVWCATNGTKTWWTAMFG